MDLSRKLEILGAAAKYDVSCSSSGSKREGSGGSLGKGHISGICHSWSDDGRCISLLKILLSNDCIFDCAYCVNRSSNDITRTTFTPEEIAEITVNFYKRNYIEGLFLSSAVFRSPDHTMELMLQTITLLRRSHGFGGYIHTKVIPGASSDLVTMAGLLSDRMSVNVELPSEKSLNLLAPQKNYRIIFDPMKSLYRKIGEHRTMVPRKGKKGYFVPAGQSTQLMIGASPETDLHILSLSQSLYGSYDLKRVYYSAYVPVSQDPRLPVIEAPPTLREHRLYQADWLLRFYNFSADEILESSDPYLSRHLDPKSSWALRHPEFFPVDINNAPYLELLRVPGIGVWSAKKIIKERKHRKLDLHNLKKMGVVMKRARHFILCQDQKTDRAFISKSQLRNLLATPGAILDRFQQLTLFPQEKETLLIRK